ncbi:hypothetical protein [Allosphingosinicella deserti]|uniref:DUF2946 domain-containing protein n=1 Tax=Allosphingosinicella deserti TaxID=2116704 RepID=A0A2P7QN41_9SPHN|nr:hypothetical protein [Sphingomonas deserti]PSJ39383.1 hypothetical protein C7I55_12225 [Sphingomonas deserti]
MQRSIFRNGHRTLLAFAVGSVLLLRLLVPVGWMPVFEGGQIRLALCAGWAPGPVASPSAHAGHSAHHDESPAPSHDTGNQGHDAPCTFASASLPWLGIDAIALEPVINANAAAGVLALVSAPGRGLAAPPPPSTGPPLLS